MIDAILTRHAVDRAGTRLGLNTKALSRTALKALEKGLRHNETTGALCRYLDGLYRLHRKGNNTRIYGEHVYIFEGDTLITILHLPHEHKAAARKCLQRRKAE